MSQLEASLPRKLARRIAGRCCYGACPDPAIDGSDYCAPHDAHERGRDAAKKRRRRLDRAKDGRCITGCGRRVGKRRVRGRIVQRRCPTCIKELRLTARDRRRVPGDARSVPGDAPRAAFRASLETNGDGHTYEVQRYGRTRRGAPSTADRDADLRSDINDAIDILTRIRDTGMGVVRSAAVAELGAIARKEARDELADQFIRVRNIATAGAEYYSRGRCAEIDALRGEAEGT